MVQGAIITRHCIEGVGQSRRFFPGKLLCTTPSYFAPLPGTLQHWLTSWRPILRELAQKFGWGDPRSEPSWRKFDFWAVFWWSGALRRCRVGKDEETAQKTAEADAGNFTNWHFLRCAKITEIFSILKHFRGADGPEVLKHPYPSDPVTFRRRKPLVRPNPSGSPPLSPSLIFLRPKRPASWQNFGLLRKRDQSQPWLGSSRGSWQKVDFSKQNLMFTKN